MITYHKDASNKFRATIVVKGVTIFASHKGFPSKKKCKLNLVDIRRELRGYDRDD